LASCLEIQDSIEGEVPEVLMAASWLPCQQDKMELSLVI
jgi:hypothetical protein